MLYPTPMPPPPRSAQCSDGQYHPLPPSSKEGAIFLSSLPAGWHQGTQAGPELQQDDAGPRIAWALPNLGRGQTIGQGGGRPCSVHRRENPAPAGQLSRC